MQKVKYRANAGCEYLQPYHEKDFPWLRTFLKVVTWMEGMEQGT